MSSDVANPCPEHPNKMRRHCIAFLSLSHLKMETSSRLLLRLLVLFFFPPAALSGEICSPITCGTMGPRIRFPFWVPGRYLCGYKGFDLSCKHNQTILTLAAGDFVVSGIDYQSQVLFIKDPDLCLPKRLLNFSLAGSPFRKGPHWRNFTFLNCSLPLEGPMEGFVPVVCLSGSHNYTTFSSIDGTYVPPRCRSQGTVSAPTYQYTFNNYVSEGLPVTWKFPDCKTCEVGGGTCGLKRGKLICSGHPRRGLPRSAEYGVIIGVGIPGLVCLIGLLCCVCNRIKTRTHRRRRRRRHDVEFSLPAITPQPGAVAAGLNSSTIESYPKSVLGHSGRLPRPNDNTCSICLAEYQPKDTLRTIPDCSHYFHAACIDKWLQMNAACPLCRSTPLESSLVTPCSSVSSFSATSSSS